MSDDERYIYLRPGADEETVPTTGVFVDFQDLCSPIPPPPAVIGTVDITGRAPGHELETISVTVDGNLETTQVQADSTWGFFPWPHTLAGSSTGITYDVVATVGGDTDQTTGEIRICELDTWVWVDGGDPYLDDHWWATGSPDLPADYLMAVGSGPAGIGYIKDSFGDLPLGARSFGGIEIIALELLTANDMLRLVFSGLAKVDGTDDIQCDIEGHGPSFTLAWDAGNDIYATVAGQTALRTYLDGQIGNDLTWTLINLDKTEADYTHDAIWQNQ